jgi:hypothetical protein
VIIGRAQGPVQHHHHHQQQEQKLKAANKKKNPRKECSTKKKTAGCSWLSQQVSQEPLPGDGRHQGRKADWPGVRDSWAQDWEAEGGI